MQIFRTGKLQDKQVLKLLDDLISAYGKSEATLHVAGNGLQYDADVHSQLFKGKDFGAIERFDFSSATGQFVVRFRRGVGQSAQQIDDNRAPSPYFDDIGLETSRGNNGAAPRPELVDSLAAIGIIKKHITFVVPEAVNAGAEGASAVLQAQLSTLNERLTEVNAEADRRRQAFDEEHVRKLREVEDMISEAEEEIKLGRKAFEAELSIRDAELQSRAKLLDDRDHMHVRRGLRENITTEIQSRLGKAMVNRASGWMRWGVFGLSLAGSAVFVWFAYIGLTEYAQAVQASIEVPGELPLLQTSSIWVLLARGTVSSVVAVSFLLYAVTWLRKIYHDDVRVQRDLERYAYDLNRASWAIETIMEARSKDGVEIPAAWINGVSRNLFDSNSGHKESDANDAIAAVLRASARAKIGPGGAEFELNSRGTNKLAKELED
jgi:hypothetical protein